MKRKKTTHQQNQSSLSGSPGASSLARSSAYSLWGLPFRSLSLVIIIDSSPPPRRCSLARHRGRDSRPASLVSSRQRGLTGLRTRMAQRVNQACEKVEKKTRIREEDEKKKKRRTSKINQRSDGFENGPASYKKVGKKHTQKKESEMRTKGGKGDGPAESVTGLQPEVGMCVACSRRWTRARTAIITVSCSHQKYNIPMSPCHSVTQRKL